MILFYFILIPPTFAISLVIRPCIPRRQYMGVPVCLLEIANTTVSIEVERSAEEALRIFADFLAILNVIHICLCLLVIPWQIQIAQNTPPLARDRCWNITGRNYYREAWDKQYLDKVNIHMCYMYTLLHVFTLCHNTTSPSKQRRASMCQCEYVSNEALHNSHTHATLRAMFLQH